MPANAPTPYHQRFLEDLGRIRAAIDTLPEAQRPRFRLLADEAEQHHRSMEADCARVRDLVDDMRLAEASVQFDLWAASRNIRASLARPAAGG